MKPRLSSLRIALLLVFGMLAGRLTASPENPPVGVAVKIWARAPSGGEFSLSGSFLPSAPGANDGYAITWESGEPLGAQGYVRIEPGKVYSLDLSAWDVSGDINIVAPPGYRVILNQTIRSRYTFEGSETILLEVQSMGASHPGLAGMASGISASEIEWRVSLGALRNGASAGELALIDSATRADWSPIFTPAMLYYEPKSDEISVYRPDNVIRQISANQVAVDIVPLPAGNPTYYEIRCYHPAQMQSGSDPRTFTGSAYVTYRVEQGGTATTLKITKEVRDVGDFVSTFPVARTEYLFLKREGSWPTFNWTRTDWSTSSTPGGAPTETYVAGGGTTSNRTESVVVRAPGTTTAVTSVTRNYTVPLFNGVSVIGEVMSSEAMGTGTGISSAFEYYTNPSDFGRLGYLKSATLPGGNWIAYDYYPTDILNGFQGGRVKYRYKPYLSSPASVPSTLSSSQGDVTYHEYVNDIWGAQTRLSLVERKINDTVVSRTATSYVDNYGTANGHALSQSVRTEFSAPDQTVGEGLNTTTRFYSDDVEDKFVRGQTHSVSKPGGVKQSFAYQLGTWNGSNFTAGSGIGTGTASRIAVITGSSLSSAGVTYTTIDGYTLDTIYLVDGKSTKEVTIRDSRALVVRTESHTWKSGAWQLVSYTNFDYDYAGRLTSRSGSNGATYGATYSGGLKTSETDEAGIVTTFTHDAAGRVSVATRTASGVIGAVATRFTYDAAGRVTKEEVGYGQTNPITTQRQFDDAGRLTLLTPSGSFGVESYAYNLTNRTQTTTRADGSTIITTDYPDGRRHSVTGTGRVAEYHTYGVEFGGKRWHRVDSGTSTSARWKKTWQDWLGRETKSEHPGYTGQPSIVAESIYELGTGRLLKTTKTGLAPTLFQYNALSQVVRSGLDYDNNGALDLASHDRITDTDTYLESYNSAWWTRTDTKTYPKLGLSTVTVTSTSRTRLTGHPASRLSETQSIDAEGNVTTQTVDSNRSARTSVATTTRSGLSSTMVETTVNGFSTSVTSFEGLVVTKGYDSFLRPSTAKDSRNNVTTTTYVPGTTLMQSVTNQAGNSSVTTYDNMGRVSTVRDAANHYTRSSYTLRGQLFRVWGDAAMPVEYSYDSTFGDRLTMKTFRGGTAWNDATWPSSPGTADTTTWTYDGPSGLLTGKTDALGRTGNQTYNVRGQTHTRELVRTIASGPYNGQRVKTTYSYDGATGELLGQTYNDGTPSVTFTYGRTGQVESVADTTGMRDMVYDDNKPWRMVAEAQSSFYGGRSLTRLYDESGTIGRVRGFQLGAGTIPAADLQQTFGFTSVGRFETIASSRANNSGTARTFRYGYLAASSLLETLSIDGHAFQISRTYETQRDLVTTIDSKWSTTLRAGYTYTYDERGQRSKVVQTGDIFIDYGDATSQQFSYNGRGELTGAIGYMGSDITQSTKQLPGRRHEYGYDTAGNRLWSNRTGVPALRDDYTTNALNQYTTRENNTVPLSGTAEPDNGGQGGVAVSVKGGTLAPVAAGRQGRYWNDEITVNNNANPSSPNPWRGALTIFTAKRGTGGSADVYRADSRMAEIGARLQTFTYDLDGNLTGDGITEHTYDAENRLIRMETTSMARTWGFPWRVLEFRYDYMGRRVQKRVVDVTQNQEISSRRFLYDGWNLIAEYAAPGGAVCGALLRSYTWGLDIAGQDSSAGGPGCLLQIADHASGKTFLPCYDGNGNVVALINADNGNIAAAYEYSPFGEFLRCESPDSTVADQPFRFSTKFYDGETGLYFYGRRYMSPSQGRFLGRDPLQEQGGLNLYGFTRNNPINLWDRFGMAPYGNPMNGSDVHSEVVVVDGIVYNRTWGTEGSGNEGDEYRWSDEYHDEAIGTYSPDGYMDFGAGSHGDGGYGGDSDFIMPDIGIGIVIAATTPLQGQPRPVTTTVQIFARPIIVSGVNVGLHAFVVVTSGSQSVVLSAMPSRKYTSDAEQLQNLTSDVGITITPQDPQPKTIRQSSEWRNYTQARIQNPRSVYQSGVLAFNGSFDEAMASVNTFNAAVNNADIPYISTTTNSNAYAFSLVNHLTGIQVIPQPNVNIRGYNIPLFPEFILTPTP